VKPSAEAGEQDTAPVDDCKIVAIGASAGGLEALDLFLRAVPADSGLAFVIVQHLDPGNDGLLPELLQRSTTMKVVQVTDGTRAVPNQVYVIPPAKNMSILHGALHLFDLVTPRGLRLPIDFFFRSLADDCEERSIGVVLSGMGSDGTLGLKAIKGKAGVVFVQDPETAKFAGMPQSAIQAGVADVVGAPDKLPAQILAYLEHSVLHTESVSPEAAPGHALEQVVILLRSHTGHDFSLYKTNTVSRRIERRMGLHQIGAMSTYVRYLQENPAEIDALFKELLIGVTNFFRDPAAWETLSAQVIPALLKEHDPSIPLRVWVVPCSTGEEAYSMAILLREAFDAMEPARNMAAQIFATDLDPEACHQLRSLGLTSECQLRLCKKGEPCIVQVRSTRIGLSNEVARRILVMPLIPSV